jgi:hypothetical protein
VKQWKYGLNMFDMFNYYQGLNNLRDSLMWASYDFINPNQSIWPKKWRLKLVSPCITIWRGYFFLFTLETSWHASTKYVLSQLVSINLFKGGMITLRPWGYFYHQYLWKITRTHTHMSCFKSTMCRGFFLLNPPISWGTSGIPNKHFIHG